MVLNFKLIVGIIGIALIACNALFFIPLPLPIPIPISLVVITSFQDAVIAYSTFLLTITIGFMLYVVGRKEFSKLVKGCRIASGLLMFFGLILTVGALMFLGVAASSLGYDIRESQLRRISVDLSTYSLIFLWCGFGFVSGVLWLVDGAKMREVKVLPWKKEIDLKSQTRYPEDLLARYTKRYPHNPTGVLEWHIHKKMKEGKTREQAIKELEDIQ